MAKLPLLVALALVGYVEYYLQLPLALALALGLGLALVGSVEYYLQPVSYTHLTLPTKA